MSRTSRYLTQSLSPSCGFFSNMHENRMNIGDFYGLAVWQNWGPKQTPRDTKPSMAGSPASLHASSGTGRALIISLLKCFRGRLDRLHKI